MHDYFDILGVSPNARAPEIRQACRRRIHQAHPDIGEDDHPRWGQPPADLSDTAVDFIDLTAIVRRMRAAFFATDR